MGSPTTFKRRPSTASPTGTVIGEPVSTTSVPQARPAVSCIATHRAVIISVWCCTSKIKGFALGHRTSSAVLIFGSLAFGNRTSTTEPETWETVPCARPFILSFAEAGCFTAKPSAHHQSCKMRMPADVAGQLSLPLQSGENTIHLPLESNAGDKQARTTGSGQTFLQVFLEVPMKAAERSGRIRARQALNQPSLVILKPGLSGHDRSHTHIPDLQKGRTSLSTQTCTTRP